MKPDEVGTPPDYQTGIGPQQVTVHITGTGTRVVTRTRPDKRTG